MTDLKEQAKTIIAKGKALNDPELIRMGLEMLDAYGEPEAETKPKRGRPAKKEQSQPKKIVTSISNTTLDMSQFTMSKASSNVIDKSGKKQQIYIGPRENKYHDEGEHKEIVTPKIKKTDRTRKPAEAQKVLQTCEVCGKKEKVLPLYAREYYRCESCLLKGKA